MIVGIEISPGSVRGVRLDGFVPRLRLGPMIEVACAPAESSALPPASALSDLLRQLDCPKASVAVAVPSNWCCYRALAFPYRSPARVESTMTYALEGRLPGAIEGHIVEPTGEARAAGARGAHIHVAACPVERLKELLATFRQARPPIEPCVVQPAIVAVAQALRAARPRPAGNELLLRCEGGTADLAFLDRGEIAACQSVRLACRDMRDAQYVREISDAARAAIRRYQVGDGSVPVRRLLLIAPEPARQALAAELRATLSLPVEPAPSEMPDAPWVAAWGAALDAAARKHAAPNLRRGECAYRPYARRAERRIAAALALAAALVGLLGVHTARALARVRTSLHRDLARETEVFREVTGLKREPALALMEAAVAEAKKEADRSGNIRTASCLKRWVDLMALVPEQSGIHFDVLDINQQRIAISARATNQAGPWDLREKIEASPSFAPESPNVSSRHTEGNWPFTMELKYR